MITVLIELDWLSFFCAVFSLSLFSNKLYLANNNVVCRTILCKLKNHFSYTKTHYNIPLNGQYVDQILRKYLGKYLYQLLQIAYTIRKLCQPINPLYNPHKLLAFISSILRSVWFHFLLILRITTLESRIIMNRLNAKVVGWCNVHSVLPVQFSFIAIEMPHNSKDISIRNQCRELVLDISTLSFDISKYTIKLIQWKCVEILREPKNPIIWRKKKKYI